MKFESINTYLTGLFMFKGNNDLFPSIFLNIFAQNTDIHNYDTRQKFNLHIFPCRTNLTLFSIKYHGSRI